jgi:hypothetical protein
LSAADASTTPFRHKASTQCVPGTDSLPAKAGTSLWSVDCRCRGNEGNFLAFLDRFMPAH